MPSDGDSRSLVKKGAGLGVAEPVLFAGDDRNVGDPAAASLCGAAAVDAAGVAGSAELRDAESFSVCCVCVPVCRHQCANIGLT